jgi:hypothetical protein
MQLRSNVSFHWLVREDATSLSKLREQALTWGFLGIVITVPKITIVGHRKGLKKLRPNTQLAFQRSWLAFTFYLADRNESGYGF